MENEQSVIDKANALKALSEMKSIPELEINNSEEKLLYALIKTTMDSDVRFYVKKQIISRLAE